MDFILLFLEKDILPEEKSETEKVRRNASQFWLSEALFALCTPRGIRITPREAPRRGLWKSHRRKISVS